MPKRPDSFKPSWLSKAKPKQAQSGRTSENRHIYNSTRWRKLSAAHKRAHPLCVECEKKGFVVPVKVTDHIVPINNGGDPWDWKNLQSMCNMHHNKKSGREAHANKG